MFLFWKSSLWNDKNMFVNSETLTGHPFGEGFRHRLMNLLSYGLHHKRQSITFSESLGTLTNVNIIKRLVSEFAHYSFWMNCEASALPKLALNCRKGTLALPRKVPPSIRISATPCLWIGKLNADMFDAKQLQVSLSLIQLCMMPIPPQLFE